MRVDNVDIQNLGAADVPHHGVGGIRADLLLDSSTCAEPKELTLLEDAQLES